MTNDEWRRVLLRHSGFVIDSSFWFGVSGFPRTMMPRTSTEPPVSHVVLLGDSIFDNASYVPGGPAVVEQLRGKVQRGWRATLLAVDGAVCGSVGSQLRRL